MKLSNVVKSIPAIGFDVCRYPESGIPIPVKWSQNISGLNNGLLLHKMILLPSEMGNIVRAREILWKGIPLSLDVGWCWITNKSCQTVADLLYRHFDALF